jgi:hypothetical protein
MNVGAAALIARDCLAYDLRNKTGLTSLFNTIVATPRQSCYSAWLMSAARQRRSIFDGNKIVLKLNEKFMTDG